VAAVLFGPVYSLRRVGRSSLSTTNEPACRLVFLCPDLVFCLFVPPFFLQCSCEFKALKGFFRTVQSAATNILTMDIWVSGALGMWV
jgi:hypothetical protein